MRSALLDTLTEDYIRSARAKGLTQSQTLWRHALRNALGEYVSSGTRPDPAARAEGLTAIEQLRMAGSDASAILMLDQMFGARQPEKAGK